MYDSGPTEEDAKSLASFGVSLDDFESEVVEAWLENELSMRVFEAMGTQWRMGFNGPTGLDYSVLTIVLDEFDVPKYKRKSMFADIRVMEGAALAEMRESRKS